MDRHAPGNFNNRNNQIKQDLQNYLLITYRGQLDIRDIRQMANNFDLNLKATAFDPESVNAIAEMHLNKKKELEEEASVFDNPDQGNQQGGPPKRTSKDILKQIASKYKDETKFKIMCNKLFKMLSSYLKNKKNPLNTFVAILADDYENNSVIMSLIDEVCERHELITEIKPKGILIKANPAAFDGQYESLKSILSKLKDESLGIGPGTGSSKSKRAGRQRNVTNERVLAMKEAHERRVQMARNQGYGRNQPQQGQGSYPGYGNQNYGQGYQGNRNNNRMAYPGGGQGMGGGHPQYNQRAPLNAQYRAAGPQNANFRGGAYMGQGGGGQFQGMAAGFDPRTGAPYAYMAQGQFQNR